MVKGVSKQVIMVRSPDKKLFEQAIFILKEGARPVTDEMLLREAKGENGFGYDPIFYYPPMGMTTAEMPSEAKNQVSHRGNALKVFYEKLKEAGYADK